MPAEKIHTIQKLIQSMFIGRMKSRPIPTQSPDIMHAHIVQAHLAIHNCIFGRITKHLLISRGSAIATYRTYEFTPDRHYSVLINLIFKFWYKSFIITLLYRGHSNKIFNNTIICRQPLYTLEFVHFQPPSGFVLKELRLSIIFQVAEIAVHCKMKL